MIDRASKFTNTRRLLVFGTIILFAIGSFTLTIAMLGGKESLSQPDKPQLPVGFSSRDVYMFDSLDQIVATSDLVVTGTVVEVLPGEIEGAETFEVTAGYSEEPNALEIEAMEAPPEKSSATGVEEIRHLNAVVEIDESLKGSAPTDTATVETLELAYSSPTEWREPGQRVLLFLSRSREPEKPAQFYVPINHDQSVYILQNNDLVATVSDPAMPFSENIARLSLLQLRLKVEETKEKIASGEVTPLPEMR